MKIAVLGFGREGQSLLKFLRKEPQFKNAEIWVLDKNKNTKMPAGVQKNLGENYLKNLEQFDIIFRSPGIPYLSKEIQKAKKAGVEISSPTKLFFDEIEKGSRVVIGITGTKGKGTTSTLLYKILKAAGRHVFLAGNIGLPALDILPKLKRNSFIILELSSFQLQDLSRSPHIAAVLDIFPDHLENIKTAEHGTHISFAEYIASKANIAKHQDKNDKVFFFQNNRFSRAIAQRGRGGKIGLDDKKFHLFRQTDLKIKGLHNFRNAMIAATIAADLGVARKVILKAVKNFKGVEHRLELVRKIGGVEFYNDSASTNPQTAAAAVQSFPAREKILIAGGHDKNLDYQPLAKSLKNSNTKLVILFGQNKKKIEKAIRGQGYKIILVEDLRTAVRTAHNCAKKPIHQFTNSLVAVIFSPGAASFDMFQNYADRGQQFKKLVKRLQ